MCVYIHIYIQVNARLDEIVYASETQQSFFKSEFNRVFMLKPSPLNTRKVSPLEYIFMYIYVHVYDIYLCTCIHTYVCIFCAQAITPSYLKGICT